MQKLISERETHAQAAEMQESATVAAEAATMGGIQAAKTFNLPWVWAWGAPVFKATAAALIAVQAGTQIPWFPFIVMCGVGVRMVLAPMMIR